MSSSTNKLTIERNQRLLLELASKPGNDVCADCKSRNPRWASHNLGIFIWYFAFVYNGSWHVLTFSECRMCKHPSQDRDPHKQSVSRRFKSLTLDSWTKDQVDKMREIGNVKSNAIYNPNEVRNPPPTVLDDPTRDNDLEQYIRSKYEYRRFLDKKALATSRLGPSRSASSVPIATAAPPTQPTRPSTQPRVDSMPATATDIAADMFSTTKAHLQPRPTMQPPITQSQPTRSISQPAISQNPLVQSAPAKRPEGVWADLVSLQGPSSNASLPLQYQASNPTFSGMTAGNTMPMGLPGASVNMTASGLPLRTSSLNPFSQSSFATGFNQTNQSFLPQMPQMQPQPTSVPFHQPTPLPSSPMPPQFQPQFVSSSPNPQYLAPSPSAQLMPSPSPQLQPTMPNPSFQPAFGNSPANGFAPGYMTPSPQPMMAAMPGQTQMSGMGMQPMGTFNPGMMQPQQQPMTMNGQYGQGQYMQGGFPGQAGTQQWGPL
ncbi:hypothetical protein AGABI2DRAFT_121137 [Agaricus bisporus var. bisporus H97]|nr:hypothetical protein AGABI2DRAFT_121137 [Agaricus bisporus var. bisporus H97]EKV43933.1 hypothetical protein AGABI2DRAFT_121137 [Agaricus bisporus var. bisporus H97]